MSDKQEARFLFDPYMDWVKGEGVPVVEAFGINLLDVETGPWPRYDTGGAFVHLKGRGDFISIFIVDIPPGAKTAPQQHLYEEVIYVLSGHGSTTIETGDGAKHSFEWGPKSLFALPLNAKYQHFNASGREPARMASTNDLCLVLNLFHNADFVFNNTAHFADRRGKSNYFSGEGDFIPKKPGRHMWETNFIPDLAGFELQSWDKRGAGSSNMKFILADGTMHAHSSEMPVGTYKKAHRHGADFHVYCVTGGGYSLFWYEDDADFERIDWKHGVVFAPPDGMYHQHYNTAARPSRYLAVALGSLRYPFTTAKMNIFTGVDVSVKDGGAQIEYEDQDPRVHELYLAELAKKGVETHMGEYIDESIFKKNNA
jgi:uncharacterized RmlC-like cupin family protein